MEPLNDRDLDRLLAEWQAPQTPVSLDARVRAARRMAWWGWLWSGSVRVPVPLALGLTMVLLALLFVAVRGVPRGRERAGTTAAEFQPVKRLEPRIIRSNYESNY